MIEFDLPIWALAAIVGAVAGLGRTGKLRGAIIGAFLFAVAALAFYG